jgi:hypothetical protein
MYRFYTDNADGWRLVCDDTAKIVGLDVLVAVLSSYVEELPLGTRRVFDDEVYAMAGLGLRRDLDLPRTCGEISYPPAFVMLVDRCLRRGRDGGV